MRFLISDCARVETKSVKVCLALSSVDGDGYSPIVRLMSSAEMVVPSDSTTARTTAF